MANKLKPFPKFMSDAEAERFVETADLSQYDLMAGALPRDEWFARAEESTRTHGSLCACRRPSSMRTRPRPRPAACLISG
jgi:hypothetical protein